MKILLHLYFLEEKRILPKVDGGDGSQRKWPVSHFDGGVGEGGQLWLPLLLMADDGQQQLVMSSGSGWAKRQLGQIIHFHRKGMDGHIPMAISIF